MIRLTSFTGSFPVVPPQLLPDDAAQYAKDCEVRHGELSGLYGAQSVFTTLPAGTKGVFTPDGYNALSTTQPLYASLSPVAAIDRQRVYYTSDAATGGVRFCFQADLSPNGGVPANNWRAGVPAATIGLTVSKNRKNYWPGYEGKTTTLKGKFFLEANGLRYKTVNVTPTAKQISPGVYAEAFTAYTFDSTINVAQIQQDAADSAMTTTVGDGDTFTATGFTAASGVTFDGTDYTAGQFVNFTESRTCSISGSSLIVQGGLLSYVQQTVTTSQVTSITLSDGRIATISASSAADNTEPPEDAAPCLELWLEDADGQRIWTTFTNATTSSGSITSIPGGADVSMAPVTGSNTQYEINFTFGVVEDRAYVYTIVNDLGEESQPSTPGTVSVTHMDDVILRLDYDAVANLLTSGGFYKFQDIRFYCSTGGPYVQINHKPALASSITDLYHSILGREPDASGLAYWTNQYNAGMTLDQIAGEMRKSVEYGSPLYYVLLEDLYTKLLNRSTPDEAGFEYWIKKLESGTALWDVIKSFLTSSEYQALHTGDTSYVTSAGTYKFPSISSFYTLFYNASPDSAGLTYWTARLASGDALEVFSALVYGLITSTYYESLRITAWVTYLLNRAYGRTPTAGEISAAVTKYNTGHSLNTILVSESSITADGFLDPGGNRTTGVTLPSLTWACPPASLKMLTQLPNGIFAACDKNYIYFSEPYLPFAWPSEYIQVLPSDVVGMLPYNGQMLVTTTASPLMITGVHPSGMTQQKIGSAEAGVSAFGIAIVQGLPVYASKDGLVTIEGNSGSLQMSQQFFTAEKWRSTYGSRLSGIKLVAHDGKLIAMFNTGDGFIVHYATGKPHLIEFSQTGGYPFYVPGEESLYIATGSSNLKLFFGTQSSYTWWSKEYTLPFPTSLAMGKIVHNGAATVTFYGNGTQLSQVSLTGSTWKETQFRLPAGTRYTRFSFKVVGAAVIQEVHIVPAGERLRDV